VSTTTTNKIKNTKNTKGGKTKKRLQAGRGVGVRRCPLGRDTPRAPPFDYPHKMKNNIIKN